MVCGIETLLDSFIIYNLFVYFIIVRYFFIRGWGFSKILLVWKMFVRKLGKILKSLLPTALSVFILLAFVVDAYSINAPDQSAQMDPKVEELIDRFAKTKAIGVFTKLSIQTNVTRLHNAFTGYHQGKQPPSIEELRERFDLMVQEMMVLVQDKDPELARDLHTSRLLLWSYLSSPGKLVTT